MNENFEEGLSVDEREALNRLKREVEPPPFLEERVIAELKHANLLLGTKPRWRPRTPRIFIRIAASLLIFFMGAYTGAKFWTETTISNTPQFMILLKAGESSRLRSSEEIRRTVEEYSNWARHLRQQGVRIEGEKLKQETRVLGETNELSSREDQSRVGQKTISGYFFVEAEDYEHAVRIASGCPHLKYGGTIEVRQIDRF